MRLWHLALAVTVACATLAVAQQKNLTIQNVTLSQYEDGPAVGSAYSFIPGETIFFSYQISGYRSEGDEDKSIRLSWRVEAADPAGVPIVEPGAAKIETGLAQEDKSWMPKVRQTIEVPPFAAPGTYRINMWVKDEVAQAEVRREAEFKVRGRSVEPSPTLIVRNFGFYRDEEDKKPLDPAVYRPGDTVWVRFDITGYKFAEKNRLEVGYGITVLRPNGETTFSQPEAAVERHESFYPRGFVPAVLSLNLPKDVQTGQFTVIITVADKIGDQKHEVRGTFTVEQ